ncbi:MAG: hypothetical protein ACYTFT_01100 [Planctomycetota bacterium]|jgi:hypothetical protein
MTTLAIALVHAAATLFMAGLIWFVQVVHYPLLARVGTIDFVAYEAAHVRRTSWVVIPPMITEVAAAAALALLQPPGVPPWMLWLGLGLVGLIWGSTVSLQVPAHRALEQRFDVAVHARLVATNWLRTALWSVRAVLGLWIVYLLKTA